jgi:undecaprenyl-diphosphatase
MTALVSLAIAALVVAAAYATVWTLRPVTTRLGSHRWTAAARRRGQSGVAWLTVRVAADVAIVAAGAAVVLSLAAAFVAILDSVTEADGLTIIDRAVGDWLVGHRRPVLNQIEIAVTNLGGTIVLVASVSLVAAYTAVRLRSWYPVVLAVVGLGGSQALVTIIKISIARPRPNPPAQLVSASGFSFPSGHSASSLVGFALLAWLTCMLTADRAIWATVWTAAAMGTVAVGVSRIYLGVHYPTDVIGGWALGLTWLAVVAVAARVWRMRSLPAQSDADRPE